MLGRVALTNGPWKMQEILIFSIVLLLKEIFQIFLGDVFFLTTGGGLGVLESISSDVINYH